MLVFDLLFDDAMRRWRRREGRYNRACVHWMQPPTISFVSSVTCSGVLAFDLLFDDAMLCIVGGGETAGTIGLVHV